MSKIKDFETAYRTSNTTTTFATLLESKLLSREAKSTIRSIIDENPVLKGLYSKELLLFSTKYRRSTLRQLTDAHDKGLCSATQELEKVIIESLSSFNEEFKIASIPAKAFLTTLSTALVESKALQSVSQLDSSFEGLCIEAVPHFQDKSRSESYDPTSQGVSICFRKFTGPLVAEDTPCKFLTHEFTHAYDDVYQKVRSVKVVYDKLAKYAKGSTTIEAQILECASDLADDTGILKAQYLNNGKGSAPIFKNESQLEMDVWRAEVSANKGNERIFQCSGEGDDIPAGKLRCNIALMEFLTFSTECIFDNLSNSTNPEEFNRLYKKDIESRAKEIHQKYPPDVLGAAFELVQDTTSAYLNCISSHTLDADLQKCCGNAIKVLEDEYKKIIQEGVFKKIEGNTLFLADDSGISRRGQKTSSQQAETLVEDEIKHEATSSLPFIPQQTSTVTTNLQTVQPHHQTLESTLSQQIESVDITSPTSPSASGAQEETSTSVPVEKTYGIADRLRQGLIASQSVTEAQYHHPNHLIRQVQPEATQSEDNPKTPLDTNQAPQRVEEAQQIRGQLQDQQVPSSSQTNSPPSKRSMNVRTPSPNDRTSSSTRYSAL